MRRYAIDISASNIFLVISHYCMQPWKEIAISLEKIVGKSCNFHKCCKQDLKSGYLAEERDGSSARTWPNFSYRYIVQNDDRLSIKNDNLVTWGGTELTHISLLMARYTGDAFR